MAIELQTTALLKSLNQLRKNLRLQKGAAICIDYNQGGTPRFGIGKITNKSDPVLLHFFFPPAQRFSYLRDALVRDMQCNRAPDAEKLGEVYCQVFEPMTEHWELCAEHLLCNYGTSVWVQDYADRNRDNLPDAETVIAHNLEDSVDRYRRIVGAFLKDEVISLFWKDNQLTTALDHLFSDASMQDDDDDDDDDFEIDGLKIKECDIIIAWILIWIASFPCNSNENLAAAQKIFIAQLTDEIQKRFNDNDNVPEDSGSNDPTPEEPKYVDELIREQWNNDFSKIADYEDLRSLISEILESCKYDRIYNLYAYYDRECFDEVNNSLTKEAASIHEQGKIRIKKPDD